MQAEATVEPYPESWDEVDQAKAEGSSYLEVASGEKVRLKILQGPLTFRSAYLATNEKTKKGESQKKTFNIPFASQVPGYKFTAKYAFEVVVLDGPAKGQHKTWKAGQKVAEQLKSVKEEWGSIREPIIVLKREGEKLETVWTVTAAKGDGSNYPCTIDLQGAIGFATKEQLDSLPPPPITKQDGSLSNPISSEQVQFISSLSSQKDITLDWVNKTINRKWSPKSEIDQLTSGEASELITLLKGI